MMKLILSLLVALTAATRPVFPESWGEEPMIQTMDYRPLPGGYGHGSSTLSAWILEKMATEREKTGSVSYPPAFGEPPRMQTRDLRPLPFGYGMGSGTIATWLSRQAEAVYGETVDEYVPME